MAVSAYVLIQTELGKAADVASVVGDIPGVVSSDDGHRSVRCDRSGRGRLAR